MSDLTKRHINLLIQLVDAEIKRICRDSGDPEVPHIVATCADCGFVFDVRFNGLDCPACHHAGVRDVQTIPKSETSERLRTAMDRIAEWQAAALSNDVERSIAECESIFSLDSTGSKL